MWVYAKKHWRLGYAFQSMSFALEATDDVLLAWKYSVPNRGTDIIIIRATSTARSASTTNWNGSSYEKKRSA